MKTVVDCHPDVDQYLKDIADRFGTPACTRCTKPTCCQQLVLIYDSEAAALAGAIRDNPPLLENLRQWVRTFFVLRRVEQTDADAYFRTRRKCPFLVAGRCAVYAHRPVACRTYFSFEETPERCDPDIYPDNPPVEQLDTLNLHRKLYGLESRIRNLGLATLAELEPGTLLGKQAAALDAFLMEKLFPSIKEVR